MTNFSNYYDVPFLAELYLRFNDKLVKTLWVIGDHKNEGSVDGLLVSTRAHGGTHWFAPNSKYHFKGI